MSVLLVGSGDLGTAVGLRCVAGGQRVQAVRRSIEKLPAAFEGQRADLTTTPPRIPRDTEIVIVALAPDRRDLSAYRSLYLRGVINTVEALSRAAAQPRRVIFVSSTSVYGGIDGWVDESTDPRPSTETSQVLLEAEAYLREHVSSAVVIRLGGIYGPGRDYLIRQVKADPFAVSDPGKYTNRIHRDDAAQAIVHLAHVAAAPEAVYIGVDDAPVRKGEVVRFLAGELGVQVPDEPIAAGWGKRCHNDLLRASGFQPAYPTYREGYLDVLAGHGQRYK